MTTAGALLTGVWTAEQLKTEGNAPGLGDRFTGPDGKIYKFVKYSDGTGDLDLVAGDVVHYVDVTGYTTNTVTADVSDASGQEIGAGVVQTAVTLDGSHIWIQIKGQATLSTALGGSAGDGDPLTAVGAADKALTKAAEADSTGVYKSVVAFAVDASEKTIACDFPF
jgi:hypothetical protein